MGCLGEDVTTCIAAFAGSRLPFALVSRGWSRASPEATRFRSVFGDPHVLRYLYLEGLIPEDVTKRACYLCCRMNLEGGYLFAKYVMKSPADPWLCYRMAHRSRAIRLDALQSAVAPTGPGVPMK